ncbi:L,D-transpeptidase, partial [Myxococcota bacterium]|nr:L,D-transpeptidase [Myxococcota bacterium]
MAFLLPLIITFFTPTMKNAVSGSILKGTIRVYSKPVFLKEERGMIRGPGRYAITRRGKKCKGGYWYQLASRAWVCSGWFIPSIEPAGQLRNWNSSFATGKWYKGTGKFTYFAPSMGHLAKGKLVRLRKLRGFLPTEKRFIGKFPYFKLYFNGYVPENAVEPWPESPLRGIMAEKKDLPLVFVTEPKGSWVYEKKGAEYKPVSVLPKYAVRQVKTTAGPWLRLRTKKPLFVKRSHLNVAHGNVEAAPKELAKNERWVHVDLKENILYAFEGATLRKVFLTAGSDETPTGIHRVYWKLAYQTFNRQRSKDAYYLEAVPWVMFFKESFGIHGA